MIRFLTVDIRKIKYLFLAWLFICLLSILEVFMFQVFKPEWMSIAKILPLIRLVSGVVAILLVLVPIYNVLKTNKKSVQIIGYVLGGVLFAIVYVIVFVAVYQVCFMELSIENIKLAAIELLLENLHHFGAYYSFLLGILLIMDYFENMQAATIKKEQVERELTEAKFSNLKNQLQPHFLFNAINSVVATIDEKKDAAQEMLVDLSGLLRKSLDTDFSKKISIREELSLLNHYLNIEKKRFEHQLEVEFDIPPSSLDYSVLPFILQPLVENAIKHGFTKGVKKLNLRVAVYLEKTHLIIKLLNNGKPLNNHKEGIGLKNLKARLKNEHGEQYSFLLFQEDEFVVNEIKIKVNEN